MSFGMYSRWTYIVVRVIGGLKSFEVIRGQILKTMTLKRKLGCSIVCECHIVLTNRIVFVGGQMSLRSVRYLVKVYIQYFVKVVNCNILRRDSLLRMSHVVYRCSTNCCKVKVWKPRENNKEGY